MSVKTYIITVKLRNSSKLIVSEPAAYSPEKIKYWIDSLEQIKKLEFLRIPITDGGLLFIHPDDVSYVKIKRVVSWYTKIWEKISKNVDNTINSLL